MPEPQASSKPILKSDEWLALFVAFGTLGTVGAYVMTRDRDMALLEPLEQQIEIDARDADRAQGDEALADEALADASSEADAAGADSDDAASSSTARSRRTNEFLDSGLRDAGALAAAGAATWRSRTSAVASLGTAADASADASNAAASNANANDAAGNGGANGAAGGGSAPIVEEGAASVSEDIAATSEPVSFSDLSADRWSKPFIDGLSQRGLISGLPDGTFAPDRPVTRAELAAQIQQIFDRDENLRDALAFGDVPNDYWGRAAIDKAVAIGFMSGYPNATFEPDKPVSRLEVAISLATGLGLNPSESPEVILAIFSDAAEIAGWAQPKIAASTQAGFVVVDPEQPAFEPEAPATREVVAAMMYQALVRAGQAEPIASDRLVTP